MKQILVMVALAATAIGPARVRAQSVSAGAGWASLMTTPVAGFTPTNNALGLPESSTRPSVQLRYGHWQFASGDENTTNFGLGITTRRNAVATTFELGYTGARHCDDCGGLLAGVDVQLPLGSSPQGSSTLEVGLNPAFGFMIGGASTRSLSGAISLPVALSIPMNPKVRLIPFVSPGVGAGYVRGGGDGESGSRVMLGAGLTLAGQGWPLRVTGSLRKVFINHAPTVYGLGLSVTP